MIEGPAQQPRFKSRRGPQTARVRFDQRHAEKAEAWNEGKMTLPQLGKVKLRGRALPTAMPKLVTVARAAAERHWASFAVDEFIASVLRARRKSVGLDVGITHIATLSTGETLENPRTLTNHLDQLKRAPIRWFHS